ncbi:hydrolase [Scheffersomyces amazonensis]|uniref:hydrolase n=1 Tax=Scheffersomyces amazonensis TaxID=1078765 RepID=UPI00315DF8B5
MVHRGLQVLIHSSSKIRNCKSITKHRHLSSALPNYNLRQFNTMTSTSYQSYTTLEEQKNNIYFGAEVVNRVSFLREDSEFVSKSLLHPSTRFIFYLDSDPLVSKYLEKKLIVLTNGSNQLRNNDNYDTNSKEFSKGLLNISDLNWLEILNQFQHDNKEKHPSLRDEKPSFLFLGLFDQSVGLDLLKLKMEDISIDEEGSQDERYLDYQGRYQGIPYYAVDLTDSPELSKLIISFVNDRINLVSNTPEKTPDDNGIFYTKSRKHYLTFTNVEAALYSHGKMYFDWINRNRFCPGCGHKVIPIHAGGKLHCTNQETFSDNEGKIKSNCPVKRAHVSNVTFPRTDAVVITAITNEERTKILLSLGKRHAATRMYACTAGFMEPSETVEVALKREIWEETGVRCNSIELVMTQPWPFPGNLMIGCLAVVQFNGENEIIHLGHDKELEDAKWFDISFIRKLVYPEEAADENIEDYNPDMILIPMPESVAFQLIKMIIDQAADKHKLKDNKL